jgi:NADPH:quinone reductase-like Zn-dependent oxidoreductase
VQDKELKEGADLLAKGTIKPVVDQTFSFTKAHEAYDRSKSGR